MSINSAIATPRLTPGPWKIEQRYANWIDIFGRQVPLPTGEWILVGVGVDPTNQPARAYGLIGTLVLFKLENSSITAFTLIHANAIAIDGGWGMSRDCQRTDLPFVKIYENGEQHAFCAFIRPLTTSPQTAEQDLTVWQDAIQLARQRNWNIPVTWREVGFRICDWHDILDIRYVFALQKLEQNQDKTSNLDKTTNSILISWVDALLPKVYLGFKHSLNGQPAPNMPGEPKFAIQGEWANIASSKENLSNSAFSLWKVAINRIINIGTSLGIDYLFIGDIYLVAGLQVFSSTFHGGVDYVEELLWNTYGPQRLRQAETYDFTYVGQE